MSTTRTGAKHSGERQSTGEGQGADEGADAHSPEKDERAESKGEQSDTTTDPTGAEAGTTEEGSKEPSSNNDLLKMFGMTDIGDEEKISEEQKNRVLALRKVLRGNPRTEGKFARIPDKTAAAAIDEETRNRLRGVVGSTKAQSWRRVFAAISRTVKTDPLIELLITKSGLVRSVRSIANGGEYEGDRLSDQQIDEIGTVRSILAETSRQYRGAVRPLVPAELTGEAKAELRGVDQAAAEDQPRKLLEMAIEEMGGEKAFARSVHAHMVEVTMEAGTVEAARTETDKALELTRILSEERRQETEDLVRSVEEDLLGKAKAGDYGGAVGEAAAQLDRYAKLAKASGGKAATVREQLEDLEKTEERAKKEQKELLAMLKAQTKESESALDEQVKKIAAVTPGSVDRADKPPKDNRTGTDKPARAERDAEFRKRGGAYAYVPWCKKNGLCTHFSVYGEGSCHMQLEPQKADDRGVMGPVRCYMGAHLPDKEILAKTDIPPGLKDLLTKRMAGTGGAG